jgi:autotransporter-associated beta strand protein
LNIFIYLLPFFSLFAKGVETFVGCVWNFSRGDLPRLLLQGEFMKLTNFFTSKIRLAALIALAHMAQVHSLPNAIWTGSNTNNDLFNDGNWIPNPPGAPVSGQTAQFGNVFIIGNSFPKVETSGTIGTLLFNGSSPPLLETNAYTFNWDNNPTTPFTYTLTLDTFGVVNSSSAVQTFNVNNGGTLSFINGSSADLTNSGLVTYNPTVGGSVQFNNTSNAGNATIAADATSTIRFFGGSTAGTASLSSSGNSNGIVFGVSAGTDTASAGSSKINLTNGAGLQFLAGTDANNATIDAYDTSIIILNTTQVSTGEGPLITLYDISQLTIMQHNTIGSLNSPSTGTKVNLGTNTLTTNEGVLVTDIYAGRIEGTGVLVKSGAGALVLTGAQNPADTWSADVNEGILAGDTTNINRNITVGPSGEVDFIQATDGTFDQTISGLGTLVKAGAGDLVITSSNIDFTGLTEIEEGNLVLDGTLNGTIHVFSTLSGTGTALGYVEVGAGGTIRPGDSIGTLTIGSFMQDAGSTYQAQVNGSGDSSLIDVTSTGTFGNGIATLGGGTVNVTSPDGTFLIGTPYTILTTQHGVIGTYDNATTSLSIYLDPRLSYDANNVFVTLGTNFAKFTDSHNERHAARQFDSMSFPSTDEQEILQALVTLDPTHLQKALDQVSGQQYASLFALTELSTRRFLRNLFIPEWLNRSDCEPCCNGIEFWKNVEYGRAFFEGDHSASGSNLHNLDIAIGAHIPIDQYWKVGAALFYEHDHIDYHLGGSGRVDTIDGAIYGLYNDDCYYLVTDLLFGYSRFNVKRSIDFATIHYAAHSHPKVFDVTLYAEAGVDVVDNGWIKLQPFLGVEVGYYHHNHVTEKGADALDLGLRSKHVCEVDSRFGLRVTSLLPYGIEVGADIAWQHRYTSIGRTARLHFKDFGSEFSIRGAKQKKNAITGTLFIAETICDNFTIFAEAAGERWPRASNYSLSFGVDVNLWSLDKIWP